MSITSYTNFQEHRHIFAGCSPEALHFLMCNQEIPNYLNL